jgi:hypothetical protein
MTLPIYGRQLIRFAETFYVAPEKEVNSYRVVVLDTPTGPSMPLSVEQGNGAAVGISQFQVADNVPPTGFGSDRVRTLTVATSGLLLVEADGTLDATHVGTQLYATVDGIASAYVEPEEEEDPVQVAVTVNGTTPTIREIVDIGETQFVVISL